MLPRVDGAGRYATDMPDAASSPDHARFVRWLLGAIAIAIVLLGGALWWLDPTSVTGRSTRFSVVENGGIRQAKLDLMEELDVAPDVLVLGSSRSMQVDPDDIFEISGATGFNGAVSGGTSEDMYLYARYAGDLWGDQFPHLVLGVVNDVTRDGGTASLDPRLKRYLPRARTERGTLEVLRELLQVRTLKAAIRSTRHVVPRDGATALLDPEGGTDRVDAELARPGRQKNNRRDLLSDRGMSYPSDADTEGSLQSRIDRQMEEYLASSFAPGDTFSGADERGMSLLRRTIELANAHGDTPTLWTTPFQPDARERLPAAYDERRARFHAAIAKLQDDPDLRFEFVVLDELATFDGDPEGFLDGIHMSVDNTRRVLEHLYEQRALAPLR